MDCMLTDLANCDASLLLPYLQRMRKYHSRVIAVAIKFVCAAMTKTDFLKLYRIINKVRR